MSGPGRRAGAARGARRGGVALLALLALLTCCARCAALPSNVILILADDQDVQLGGMVSEGGAIPEVTSH